MININKNHSKNIMSKCKVLSDYAEFISLVIKYSCSDSLENAILKAVDECINNDILAEFLEQYRWEACYLGYYDITIDEYKEIIERHNEELKAGIEEANKRADIAEKQNAEYKKQIAELEAKLKAANQ